MSCSHKFFGISASAFFETGFKGKRATVIAEIHGTLSIFQGSIPLWFGSSDWHNNVLSRLKKNLYRTINLYNTLGEKVDVLVDRELSIGHHEQNFDASGLSNGVYYYTINAQGKDGSVFTSTKKMVLMK